MQEHITVLPLIHTYTHGDTLSNASAWSQGLPWGSHHQEKPATCGPANTTGRDEEEDGDGEKNKECVCVWGGVDE